MADALTPEAEGLVETGLGGGGFSLEAGKGLALGHGERSPMIRW
jgi:hypothetical protein